MPDGTLADLFEGPIPTSFKDLTDRFTTEGVTSVPFAGGTQHSGTLKPVRHEPIDLGFGELELPGATEGTPFRLAIFDTPGGRWHLDIVADGLSLKLKGLQGADFVKEAGTTPRRLVRRAQDTAVVISGEATIRFAKASADAPVTLLFVENQSASDPLATTGGVVGLRCTPPHFFFGSSQFGMTLTRLLFDSSDTFSPDFITRLGQTPEWMGFAIAEATFYAPPNALGRGGFSGGVRNLLLGSPRGIQGELEVQWGRAALDPATFVFTQAGHAPVGATGSGESRLVAITATEDDRVSLQASFVASQPPEGGAVTDWTATWRWPDGTETVGDASTGSVTHGDILRVVPEETTGGRQIRHPEITFRFVASGEPPAIDVITAGSSVFNAVHASGPKAGLEGLHFHARTGQPSDVAAGTFTWKLGADGAVQDLESIQLAPGEIAGDQFLVLTETKDGSKRTARLRVHVLEGETLLVGGVDGVVTAAAPADELPLTAVESTFDLTDFHAQGSYRPLLDDAEIDGSEAGVAVPAGALALVTLSTDPAPPPPAPVEHDRHVRIVFEYNKAEPTRWSDEAKPAGVAQAGSPDGIHRQLLAWAARYPGASFLVVGRCDDIGGDDFNKDLASRRRDTAVRYLTTVPAGSGLAALDAADITSWGEQDGQPGTVPTSPLDSEEAAAQRLILAVDDGSGDPLVDRSAWPSGRDTAGPSEPVRAEFRRVDVYAVGGTPAASAEVKEVDDGRSPALRRMLVPGETATPVPAIASTPASDYRVRLMVAWDKPSGDGWRDLIPSKAEFEYAWSPDTDPLPDLEGEPVTLEVLTVYGGWRHDDATGFTRAQLGIRSDGDPEGLMSFTQPNLVAAMALGPVLLSEVSSDTDTIEKGARIAALAAGTAFAQVDLGGGPLVGPGSKAVIKSIEASTEIKDIDEVGDDYKISLTSDYTTILHVNTGALGLKTDPDHPVKFRYKKVSIVFDQSKDDFWDKLGVSYPTDSMEIEDPGKWKVDGVLGQLLRAVETALGKGSLWVETRFAIALNIGVVEISEAVVRVTFSGGNPPDVAFALRGLTAKIDIPATVKGEGRLRIEDPGGVIRAGLDLDLVPLKLKVSAALAMANMTDPEPFTFVSLFLKVQFPVGIPLGPSGAALHGVIGQTAINGERDVTADPDIVKRELGWWFKPPESKYRPQKGQHAVGVGAVVGTLPDASFSCSATGMIVVAFPDPEVIFAVEISLLSVPVRAPKEKKDAAQSAGLTGLIIIDDTAVALAAQARYEIPKILKVVASLSAYFPYSGDGIYVRLGSDGQAGRTGEPVTLTLLPGSLNLRAFSYLMIEQNGLPSLGGKPEFSFEGFSVGFGAGAALEWKAGPIRLSASVLLLAGIGTDPLLIKAGIWVAGELDLVVISVTARGSIVLTYQDESIWLDGEFCGEVDLFFFSLKGCVKFRIGKEPQEEIPPPPSPVSNVALTDRGGRVMGEARRDGGGPLRGQPIFEMTEVNGEARNTGADPSENQTVWADTVPVINFSHFIEDGVPAGQFVKPGAPSGEPWSGSNRLRYAFRLDDVRLIRESDGTAVSGANPLHRAWGLPSHRPPGGAGPVAPSGAETTSLSLLDWRPWGWALPMADGGASAPGSPADTIGTLCEPVPEPSRACLFGKDARSAGTDRVRLLHEVPAPGPYASRFTLLGRPGLRTATGTTEGAALSSIVAGAGGLPVAGAVIDLPQAVAGPTGPLGRGYRLPAAQFASAAGLTTTSLPWIADLDQTIQAGRLLLLVCDGRLRPPGSEPRSCYRFDGLSIGRRFTELELPDHVLTAVSPRSPFLVTDDVALAQGGLTLGGDAQPDILITVPGMSIRPLSGGRDFELHLYRRDAFGADVEWKDAEGNGGTVTADDAVGAATLRVTAPASIVEMVIVPRGKQVHLAQICTVGSEATESCFDFARADKAAVASGQFALDGVTFSVIDPRIGMRLEDWVDAGTTPAQRGSDGVPELFFPDGGVEIRPARPWTTVSLSVLSGGGPVTAIAFDHGGNAVAQAKDDSGMPVELHLAAPEIDRVVLSGGSHESVLFRVCHGEGGSVGEGETCVRFDGKPRRDLQDIALGGITVTSLDPGGLLSLEDQVDDRDPSRPQPDGRVELAIPGPGLALDLAAPVGAVTLHVATIGEGKVEAIALDARGGQVAVEGARSRGDSLLTIRLEAPEIARIELHAGGRTFLARICTAPVVGPDGELSRGEVPLVVTRKDGRSHAWTPTLLATVPDGHGGRCRAIAFDQPAAVPDASGFDIVSPNGVRVTVLSLCGIDSRAAAAQEQDQAAQGALVGTLVTVADGSLATLAREILLDPGETYRIEIDWSWQGWRSNDEGTDLPSTPVDATEWEPRQTDTYRFRVASEVLAGAETQDGLNEYVFDPRDLARYLTRTEPADGRDVVFTDDPLWVHFSAGHVEALADRHDRELVLSVRRTDPPPQPDVPALEESMLTELLDLMWLIAPASVLLPAERLINEAVAEARCLPDAPVTGGASMGARFALEKNAMYDFSLLAQRKGAPPGGGDPVVVNATRFTTSRYANPTEMLAGLGFDAAGVSPFRPEEILLADAVALPSGPLSVSDADFGAALTAVGADTLPLPGDQARTIALWRRTAAGPYGIVGFMLDAPEPMRRVAAVVQGQQAVDSVRCEPDRLVLDGVVFTPVRATQNWTRVLFVATQPVIPAGDASALELRLRVAPGGTLTGRRVVDARPLMLDTEGF
ncbi:hypothetical protein [Demequina gelatinilytica]|uniref:hypothetical protein n=1 Tax=Demequina gelatinilytica TaxID=1638980 RepID=UPI000784ED43|nr:hypothetical protein [Demequina gelatinilytica]